VIKAIFEKYGYEVVKIDRVSFAGLTKKNLPRGNWRVLTKQEIINLKHMVP
jgi:23S rRNA pseudouridine2605 synthase